MCRASLRRCRSGVRAWSGWCDCSQPAPKNQVPEDRLSDLPGPRRSVRFPEGDPGFNPGRREREGGAIRMVGNSAAPAQGQAGAAEFDACQIRQEKERDREGLGGMLILSPRLNSLPKLLNPMQPDNFRTRIPLSPSQKTICRRQVVQTAPERWGLVNAIRGDRL